MTYDKKSSLGKHLRKSCPYLKEKNIKIIRKTCEEKFSKKFKPNELLNAGEDTDDDDIKIDNEDHNEEPVNEDDEDHAECQGDPGETQDDYVSCKCGDLFNQEDFARHQEQTGHTGERIKLPRTLRF